MDPVKPKFILLLQAPLRCETRPNPKAWNSLSRGCFTRGLALLFTSSESFKSARKPRKGTNEDKELYFLPHSTPTNCRPWTAKIPHIRLYSLTSLAYSFFLFPFFYFFLLSALSCSAPTHYSITSSKKTKTGLDPQANGLCSGQASHEFHTWGLREAETGKWVCGKWRG